MFTICAVFQILMVGLSASLIEAFETQKDVDKYDLEMGMDIIQIMNTDVTTSDVIGSLLYENNSFGVNPKNEWDTPDGEKDSRINRYENRNTFKEKISTEQEKLDKGLLTSCL